MPSPSKLVTCTMCRGLGQMKAFKSLRHTIVKVKCPNCKGTGEVKDMAK